MDVYPITECPHCGGKDFYVKQSISGTGNFYVNLDGEEADNSTLHDGLSYKTVSKYAYCCDCKKRMFKITKEISLY